MEIDITANLNEIDFGAEGIKEILQNVQTILTTIIGTVPLDRGFGVDGGIIDLPIDAVKARLTANIIEAINKYELRCEITKINFEESNLDGILRPKVRVRIYEQYL